MSEKNPSINLRLARKDELETILSWLDDPTLLAVTNTRPMKPEIRSVTKEVIKAKIEKRSLWIVIRDNFRIGSIFFDSDFDWESISQTKSKQQTTKNSKTIFVYSKSRLDWAHLSSAFAEFWRIQISDLTDPVSISKLPLSGIGVAQKHAPINDTYRESPETEKSLETSSWKPVKKIRILGPKSRNESIRQRLRDQGFEVIVSPDPYDADLDDEFAPDIILSSGYDRLLRPKTIRKFPRRLINLHAAYLPWARGIGTTLFATMLRYPYGVSVHFIDEGLDTGNLIARKIVQTDKTDTLRTLYSKLLTETENLFFESFSKIVAGRTVGAPQDELSESSTTRSRQQFESVMDVCPDGYDTLITDLEKLRDSLEASNAFRQALLADSSVNL
jgi:methionyl-tRNA formyltransferase